MATLKADGATTTYTGANALVEAYNAAPNAGGEITLTGGNYNAVVVNKTIKIIGNGFGGDDATTIQPGLNVNAAGCVVHLEGLYLTGVNNPYSWPGTNVYAVQELFLINCRMQSLEFTTEFKTRATLRHCVIDQHYHHNPYDNTSNFQSITIENSIIHHFHSWITVVAPVTLDHCIILSSTNNSSARYKLPPFTFTNSILPYYLIDGGNADHCAFACNETGGSTLTNCWFDVTSMDLFGVHDLYGLGMSMKHAYNPNETYALVYPTNYMGNDGTQIGIYGGQHPWGETITLGDINADGTIDVSDINILINFILGKGDTTQYATRVDITGDNQVDMGDVNALINIMLRK